jgi:hypothetical protein
VRSIVFPRDCGTRTRRIKVRGVTVVRRDGIFCWIHFLPSILAPDMRLRISFLLRTWYESIMWCYRNAVWPCLWKLADLHIVDDIERSRWQCFLLSRCLFSPCLQRTTCDGEDSYTMLFLLECSSSCIAVPKGIREVSSF